MSGPTERSVVLGAGPVGRALVEELVAAGRDVRVATRSGDASVPSGVEVVAADVADPAGAKEACAGADVVYGCVGLDYSGWPEKWPPLMAGMIAGAEAAGARFVFMDNLYMYGPVAEPMHEGLSLTTFGSKPSTRSRITVMWQEAHDHGRIQAAAVRASDFYGPGVAMSALGERSFGRIAAGKSAQVVGDPDQLHSFTYVPDIARALVAVADAGESDMGQAWHVPNAPAVTMRDVLERFGALVDQPVKVQPMPPLMMTVVGLFNTNVREMKEMLYQWEQPFLVDSSKFTARFGIEATPLDEGLAATAAAYR